MTRRGTLLAALLVTLSRPATWPLALAAFLIRGGIVLILLPIVVLPTTVGLGTAFGPTLVSVAFGSIPGEVIVMAPSVGIGALIWLVVGGWFAAGLEAAGAWIVAGQEEVAVATTSQVTSDDRRPQRDGGVATRILIARLIAAVPLVGALALGSVRLVFVTYRELTAPLDVATSIAVRVLRGSPEVLVAVVVTWMLAEIVGALAARRIALADGGVRAGLTHAVRVLIQEPVSSLARFSLPSFVLVVALVSSALAAASAWEAVGTVLNDGGEPVPLLLSVVVFVGLWIVGLVLIGVICAWRSAVWTVAEFGRGGDVRGVH